MPHCSSELTQHELKHLLDAKTFAVLDRRALERAVELDSSMHLCATPDCPYVIAWSGPEDGPSLFNCPMCLHKRCIVCGMEALPRRVTLSTAAFIIISSSSDGSCFSDYK